MSDNPTASDISAPEHYQVLLVSSQPHDFDNLRAECKSVEVFDCLPAEMLERVKQASSSNGLDTPLVLGLDSRQLSWNETRRLLAPLTADTLLRRTPVIWILRRAQQLEYELSREEIPLLNKIYYPEDEVTALFESRLRYLIQFAASAQPYDRMAQQLLTAARQVENSLDAIITLDINYKILSWNPAAERIYGWSAHEALNKRLGELVNYRGELDADDQALVADNPRNETIWKEGKWAGWVIHRTRDNSRLIINSSVAVVRDRQGKAIELVGINRDVTDQKENERALRQSSRELSRVNSFLEGIIAQSPIGIAIMDMTGMIVDANPAYLRMIGVTNPETFIGRYNPLTIPFSIEIGVVDSIRRAMRGETVVMPPQEVDFARLDPVFGTRSDKLVFSRKFFPLFDNSGQVQNVVLMLEDVTEQRNLTNQLLQSQKMEMIGALAGGLAHDYNNLLTVLFLSIESLKQKLEHNQAAEALGELSEIEMIGKHAADLTSRLLVFTRQGPDLPELVSFSEVLHMTASLLHRTLSEDIQLLIEPSTETLPPVRASIAQLQQVLMNLVINARDAIQEHVRNNGPAAETGDSPPATISIRAFSRQIKVPPQTGLQSGSSDLLHYVVHPIVSDPNSSPGPITPLSEEGWQYVAYQVEDNGMGINADKISRIFEPFYTTKEAGKGTGLGLAICYAVARDCGGWLEVESAPGQGTRFTLFLPAVKEAAQATPPTVDLLASLESATPVNQEAPPVQPTRTVLLAEDEASLRRVISRVLGLEGWKVMEVGDGASALELYQEHQAEIDLVITDTIMPRLGGISLVNKLVQINPQVKVIMMSGYFDTSIEVESLNQLAITKQLRFISKPFRIEALTKLLHEIRF